MMDLIVGPPPRRFLARMPRLPDRSDPSPTKVLASSLPRHGWWWVALVVILFLAYQPAWHGGFVWDDDAHVTSPNLQSIGGLARIWAEPGATQQYYPVLHSAFWLEHLL